MKQSKFNRFLTVLLAICLVLGFAAPAAFAEEPEVSDYGTFLENLKILEDYADSYVVSNPKEDPKELVVNYIRTGVEKYTDGNWSTLAGAENTAFTAYVAEQDASNGTTVACLRNIVRFQLPNGQTVDFQHMFGALNMAYVAVTATGDLGGWAGDICDLMTFSKDKATGEDLEALAADIRENYLGVDERDAFGMQDVYGDLDAFYLSQQLKAGTELSEAFEGYFTEQMTDKDRASFFLNNRFSGLSTKEDVRAAVYNAYKGNAGLKVLEADRGFTAEDADLRTACCYAFADYLFDLAGDTLEGDAGDDGDQESNSLYSVFSTTESVLAPGVSQSIHYAYTADNKQIVYYVATVDINRDDLNIYANYKDHDASSWGMARVSDQMAAAQAKHSDPADAENYIENYNVILGVNADFYNMSNGTPSGALVMDGVEYHGVGSENFFAILKDGTPVIGSASEWATYADQVQEAVGGSIFLVKNGESVLDSSSSYYLNRASRTCVGITADGQVVLMALDGRQEPFSAGGSAEEIAQIMLDAGCVTAINLDGGGSTTYAAKAEGSDEVKVINKPSDGYERSVSSSLVVVSTAVVSNEFDHANISSEYDYLTVGTSLELTAIGVSVSGHAAEIPEDAVWQLSDSSIGTLEDGVFTATANGDVDVQILVDGQVAGTKTLHVVTPDGLLFTKSVINAVYGVPVELPLAATYSGNTVKMNPDDYWAGSFDETAATVEGLTFVGIEGSGVRTITVGAVLLANEEIYALMDVNLYRSDEAIFDFDNATAGNETLAWLREMGNAEDIGGNAYHVIDPTQPMEIDYTFALDMSDIEIPEKLRELTYMLPGGDIPDASAWDFLLMLAERVSVLSQVQVTAKFNENLNVDISGLQLANDYFDLTGATLDAATNTLTITANWIDQTQAIDPASANPICILSGIKLTTKDGAQWDEDQQLVVVNSGEVSYNVYLRANALYSFASNTENQAEYNLYPFVNEDVIYQGEYEKGAGFGASYATFEDIFVLDNTNRQGWYTIEKQQYYFVDNQALTGIHKLPGDTDPENEYFYSFAEDGSLIGKANGFFELDGSKYYTVAGVARTGWQTVGSADSGVSYYYFDPTTGAAVDGVQTIDGYTYTFTDCVLTRGQLVTDSVGTRYRWAGGWATLEWIEIDGKEAYAYYGGYFMTGLWKRAYTDSKVYYFAFSEDGWWMKDYSGFYDYQGGTYLIENGYVIEYPGLVMVNGDYYYINSKNVMVKDCTYWISKSNGIVPNGRYTFDADGKMVLETEPEVPDVPVEPEEPEVLNGIVKVSDDVWYYYVNGVKTYAGLIIIDGDYYYVNSKCQVVHNCTYWISKNNGYMKNQLYTFDADGKLVLETEPEVPDVPVEPEEPEVLNGIVKESDDVWYYYVDGVKTYAGLIIIDGDYYYVNSKCQVVHNCTYWISKNNGYMKNQLYTFDADGKLMLETEPEVPDVPVEPEEPEVLNGIVKESDDVWYYYVDGVKTYAGLIIIDGDYYYVNSKCQVVHNCTYWISKNNGYMKNTNYVFDADGKMVL